MAHQLPGSGRPEKICRMSTFACPICQAEKTEVIDSRTLHAQLGTRRRRECPQGHRFTTYERVESEERGHKVAIKRLMFLRTGNVFAVDEQGAQIPQEEEPAWWTVIKEKLARGVIDEATIVERPNYSVMTVGEIVRCRVSGLPLLDLASAAEAKTLPSALLEFLHTGKQNPNPE
jgi:hypothetical protein